MAFPVQIGTNQDVTFQGPSGLSSHGTPVPPFIVNSATRVYPLFDTVALKIRMFQSTNTGTDWLELDSTNAITVPPDGTGGTAPKVYEFYNAVTNTDTSTVFVVHWNASRNIALTHFDIAAGTWGTRQDSTLTYLTNGSITPTDDGVSGFSAAYRPSDSSVWMALNAGISASTDTHFPTPFRPLWDVHAAKCVTTGAWDGSYTLLSTVANSGRVWRPGAFGVCSNTIHNVFYVIPHGVDGAVTFTPQTATITRGTADFAFISWYSAIAISNAGIGYPDAFTALSGIIDVTAGTAVGNQAAYNYVSDSSGAVTSVTLASSSPFFAGFIDAVSSTNTYTGTFFAPLHTSGLISSVPSNITGTLWHQSIHPDNSVQTPTIIQTGVGYEHISSPALSTQSTTNIFTFSYNHIVVNTSTKFHIVRYEAVDTPGSFDNQAPAAINALYPANFGTSSHVYLGAPVTVSTSWAISMAMGTNWGEGYWEAAGTAGDYVFFAYDSDAAQDGIVFAYTTLSGGTWQAPVSLGTEVQGPSVYFGGDLVGAQVDFGGGPPPAGRRVYFYPQYIHRGNAPGH